MSNKEEMRSLASGPFMDVLHQRKYWRNSADELVRRKNLHLQHKANILAYLIREAGRIVAEYVYRPVFNLAPDEVQADLERMLDDPIEYILSTDMARALILDLFKAAELGPADIGLERAALMHLSPNENIQVQSSGAWMEKS